MYYSSHSLHLINQQETSGRNLQKELNLKEVPKHDEIWKRISQSIEMNKYLHFEKLDLNDPRFCFRALRSLSSSQTYHTSMFNAKIFTICVATKANLFNNFFASVYTTAIHAFAIKTFVFSPRSTNLHSRLCSCLLEIL